MPVQATDIDQEIAYILEFWIQNNNQLITGTIGQNVVWNLAQFIKQNPENYQKATVVASNSNYTTNKDECIVIFTNNSSGGLDWVDTRWNKYYFVNQTNNVRPLLNGKFYYDINGVNQTTLRARLTLYIAKGEDDFWYEVTSNIGGGTSALPPLIGVAGRGQPNDPILTSNLYQSPLLVGLGASNNGEITILINNQPQSNFGINSSFTFDNTTGLIDLSPFYWSDQDGLYIDLNQ